MNALKNKLNKFIDSTTLFVRVASILLISTVLISILISTITIQISKNTIANSFSKSNYKVLSQITENFNELNSKIITAMNIVADSPDFQNFLTKTDMTPQNYFKTIYNIDKSLGNYLSSQDSNGITICVVGVNEQRYVQNNDSMLISTKGLLNHHITEKALENENQIFYQYYHNGFTKSSEICGGWVAIKVLHDKYTKKIYGYVYAFISQEYLKKYYLPFVGNGNNIAIISNDGTVVSSNQTYEIGSNNSDLYAISQEIIDSNLTYLDTKLNTSDVSVLSKYLSTYNFNIVGIIDKNIVLDEIYNTWEITFLSLVIALIFVLIIFFIVKKTTQPILILAKTMPKIIHGDFNNHISINGSPEVRELCSAFNYMLDGLNSYVDQKMKIQNEKRKAEISALQMQINPHFIYNTLSSIKWLVWQENKTKSSEVIDAFISLLRNTISNKDEMITISEEIENLKNYVLINHVRYGDKINVNFFIMPECEKYIIPKLILQPFIENAFFHAFTDVDCGSIHVFVNKKDDSLVCEIIDNGIGMSTEELENVYRGNHKKNNNFTSIGINNVNDRIKLIYGDEYGINITSQPNKGTIVKLSIPAITNYPQTN